MLVSVDSLVPPQSILAHPVSNDLVQHGYTVTVNIHLTEDVFSNGIGMVPFNRSIVIKLDFVDSSVEKWVVAHFSYEFTILITCPSYYFPYGKIVAIPGQLFQGAGYGKVVKQIKTYSIQIKT